MEEEKTQKLQRWVEAGSALVQEVLDERSKLLQIAAGERDALSAELHQTQEEHQKLKRYISRLEDRHDAAVKDLEVQVTALQEKLAAACDELDSAKEKLRMQRGDLLRKIRDLALQLSKDKMEHMQEKNELSQKYDKIREQLGKALNSVDRLKGESNIAKSKLQIRTAELTRISDEKKDLVKTTADSKRRIEGLLAALQKSQHLEARAKSEAEMEINALKEKLEEATRVAMDEAHRAEAEAQRADNAERQSKEIYTQIQAILPHGERSTTTGNKRSQSKQSSAKLSSKRRKRSSDHAHAVEEAHTSPPAKKRRSHKPDSLQRELRDRKKVSYAYPWRGDSDVMIDPQLR